MSRLFRDNVATHDLRPPPVPTTAQADFDESSSSDSSVASAATVRPTSVEHEPSPEHWTNYFDQELWLDPLPPASATDTNDSSSNAPAVEVPSNASEASTDQQVPRYHAYITLPRNFSKGPLFICHHGAGASALSFAVLAAEIRHRLPSAGILSLSARNHGSTISSAHADYSLSTLVSDAVTSLTLISRHFQWPLFPPSILVGHSLGGAVVTTLATSHFKLFGSTLIGYAVLDVVEGSAIEALGHMRTYLSSRPKTFASIPDAVSWHVRTRTIRQQQSASVSVPSLLVPSLTNPGSWTWQTDLAATAPWWEEWFQGMSHNFLTGRGAKLLILAGTDRLDRELMIGQMQGKFQLVVIPEAGHFVHEDVPEKVAGLLVEFFRRNDRSQMVLPPKVSDLLAQGKKV